MPSGINMGIKACKGEIIIFVNAHSVLGKNFLKYSIEYLQVTNADGAGGALEWINESNSIVSHAIAFAVNSPFGSGKGYRLKEKEGFVKDTVHCAYPKKTFEKYGVLDEQLVRGQDCEFNYRILNSGGKIFFTPKIKYYTYARPSLKKMCTQYFQYGYFKPLVAQSVGVFFVWRHLATAVFTACLIFFGLTSFVYKPAIWLFLFIFSFYMVVNIIFSFVIALRNGLKYFIYLPLIFFMIHFSVGMGYLKGLLYFKLLNKRDIKDMALSR